MIFSEGKGWIYVITTVAIIGGFITVAYVLNFEYPILTGFLVGCCCSMFALLSTIVERNGL